MTTIKDKAISQAKEHKKEDPDILKTFWFPHNKEIRLIEIIKNTPTCCNGELEVFCFDGNVALGIILPDEIGKVELPKDWGTWKDAEEILIGEEKSLTD